MEDLICLLATVRTRGGGAFQTFFFGGCVPRGSKKCQGLGSRIFQFVKDNGGLDSENFEKFGSSRA